MLDISKPYFMQSLTKISNHYFSVFTGFGLLIVDCAFASIDMRQRIRLYYSPFFFLIDNDAISQSVIEHMTCISSNCSCLSL